MKNQITTLKKEILHDVVNEIESKLKTCLQFHEVTKKELVSESQIVIGSDKPSTAISRQSNSDVKCIGTFVGHTGSVSVKKCFYLSWSLSNKTKLIKLN